MLSLLQNMKNWRLALAAIGSLAAGHAMGAPGDVEAVLMASPTGIFPNATPGTSGFVEVGHAFMCIATELNSGVKEDCYGFYPKNAQTPARVIGTNLSSEFRVDKVNRFSAVTASARRKISEEERRAVSKVIDDWNAKTWSLTGPNCADFVDAVAAAAGFKRPKRSPTQTPEQYVSELAKLNE
jgi:hypothetical protein